MTSYAYDPVSRLAALADDFAGTADDHGVTFTHNPASQIVSRTRSNNQFAWTDHANQMIADTHNGLNQIVTTGSMSVTHDARGNATAIGGSPYNYDAENRMTSGLGSMLNYDPLGRVV